jgi:acyl-CoA-binding protein
MMDRPLHRVSTFRNPYHITLTICGSSTPPSNLNSTIVSSLPPNTTTTTTTYSPFLSPTPQFYGLFKQANEGDINTPKPGMMQFTERGKWTAWESQKGKSEESAKKEYVQALFAVSRTSPQGSGTRGWRRWNWGWLIDVFARVIRSLWLLWSSGLLGLL